MRFLSFPLIFFSLNAALLAELVQISGIYPSLAMFNNEGECGTGAVVPWADRLWVVTYAPHKPKGSSDKLYEITPGLKQIVRPESIGGTPANRMIHKESGQLFIGPHAIDAKGTVRTIPYSEMFGRPTGNARHLTDPANKILYATMEEGIYEVDVKSLEVKELWQDEHFAGEKWKAHEQREGRPANLHGYHGKGFYSGQGVYVYANNGIHGAPPDPTITSGVLAEWDGKADHWKEIRRNQFTEVTGPGGIEGSANPATDPIWAVGWDYRSLILGVRMPDTGWSFYRLPKGSHSYDGAHGWNTEWPRIRDIGDDDYLMTMHGTLWRFPKTFTPQNSGGIEPRSNYLKVIGDFAKWGDHIVFGCDDTAKSEFLNKRKAKGHIAGPQSQSNLWFVEPEKIDQLGSAIGRGAVWHRDAVKAGVPSDPYLFSGYDKRGLHLATDKKATITMEVDEMGNGTWKKFKKVEVESHAFVAFQTQQKGAWIRLTSSTDLEQATAAFTYRQSRKVMPSDAFDGLADANGEFSAGLIRAHGGNLRTLGYAAVDQHGEDIGYYELDADLNLVRKEDEKMHKSMKEKTMIPADAYTIDEASVLFVDDDGRRWRLPLPSKDFAKHRMGSHRVAREVATERDLCHLAGTFYELPARNAGDFAKLRPVTTHGKMIHDFCSYRGLWVLSGVKDDARGKHIIRSDDGKAALWLGAIDDAWKMGKPVGVGGPWKNSRVKAGVASDPYLLTGYDRKKLDFVSDTDLMLTIEIDLTGDGNWQSQPSIPINANVRKSEAFDETFSGYWIRFTVDKDCMASAILTYE
ncbi:MAG: hypothetical protein ACO3SO_05040 [Luteolibacter sp.]